MRLLLLTDIPPSANYTGGVVLAEQLRAMNGHEVAVFVVLNPDLQPDLYPDLATLPLKIVPKPSEVGYWDEGLDVTIREESRRSAFARTELVEQAAAFAREHRVEAVWSILEGQTVIRMANTLAQALNIPLYTQVWDPPSWWLTAHRVDPVNCVEVLEHFDEAIRNSRACATASWAMADHYSRVYGTSTVPIISSLDAEVAQRPAPVLRSETDLVIGMVGQFYAQDAWDTLLSGLAEADWRIGRREVKIYYLGSQPPPNLPAERLVHGGWMSQPDAIKALSQHADLCYCPYPFQDSFEEVARFSFPSKAMMYLAAGRPVVCHAPHYSSPSGYFVKNHAAAVCAELHPSAIYEVIKWIVIHPTIYERFCIAAREAFQEDFTHLSMRRNIARFLEGQSDG